ncbi:hypothetical protein MKX03_000747 [Papaver bracteatum]|nr:hypothetical protein MKX03_000747 [Papaver bracteatum]
MAKEEGSVSKPEEDTPKPTGSSSSSSSPQSFPPPPPLVTPAGIFDDPRGGLLPGRQEVGDGSLLVGPNDPRWLLPTDKRPDFRPPGVPPSAQFDPFGPPEIPGFEGNPRRPSFPPHPDLAPLGDPNSM